MFFAWRNSFTKTETLLKRALLAEKKGNHKFLADCGRELFRRQKNNEYALIDITASVTHIGGILFKAPFCKNNGQKLLDDAVALSRERGWADNQIRKVLLKDVPNYPLPSKDGFEQQDLSYS